MFLFGEKARNLLDADDIYGVIVFKEIWFKVDRDAEATMNFGLFGIFRGVWGFWLGWDFFSLDLARFSWWWCMQCINICINLV